MGKDPGDVSGWIGLRVTPPYPDSVAKFFYQKGLWIKKSAKHVIPLEFAADSSWQKTYGRIERMRRVF